LSAIKNQQLCAPRPGLRLRSRGGHSHWPTFNTAAADQLLQFAVRESTLFYQAPRDALNGSQLGTEQMKRSRVRICDDCSNSVGEKSIPGHPLSKFALLGNTSP
jgi:hypothetical protein